MCVFTWNFAIRSYSEQKGITKKVKIVYHVEQGENDAFYYSQYSKDRVVLQYEDVR